MAIEDDVLVIGGGLAGSIAALSAAERGARVRLVSYKQSTLRHASGLIDVLGYPPGPVDGSGGVPSRGADEDAGQSSNSGGDGPLVDPFVALNELPTGHPYERVGAAAVREALLFFDAVAGDAYRGGHTDANALVPTVGGTVKPTARYPATTAPGLASDSRPTLFVGFETLPGFDAPLVAEGLRAASVPFETRGVTLSFPGITRTDAKRTRYARILERDEPVDTGVGEAPARAALAEAVRPHLDGASRVGFPAILGDQHAAVVRRDLEERLGVDVFEVPTDPPSLPGMRLDRLLSDALSAAGVRVTTGVPVVDYAASDADETVTGVNSTGDADTVGGADAAGDEDAADDAKATGGRNASGGSDASGGGPITGGRDGDRIDHVVVDRNGQRVPYRAREYVLATGGLVGKGIASSRERVYEPIFDCHVGSPPDRYDWSVEDAFGDHPFARFGLAVDRELRPLDDGGEPTFSNLRAAGAVLGGYDYAAEKSGSGVSLATGYVAGSRAGAEVSG